MIESLKKYIERYVSLDPAEFTYFLSLLEERTFSKNEYLLRADRTCSNQYFLTEGLVRSFYINDAGIEKIVQFGIENWWVTNMESFVHQTPSSINIQALEKTTVLSISKENMELAYARSPKFERLFRLITERWLIAQQRNSHFYMKAKSSERYQVLVKAIPDFVQRVPQYMIASYLDITPEYLSELRKLNY